MSTMITSRDRLATTKRILQVGPSSVFCVDDKIVVSNGLYGVLFDEPFAGLPEPEPQSHSLAMSDFIRCIFSSFSGCISWNGEFPTVSFIEELLKSADEGECLKYYSDREEYAWRADYLLDVLKLIGPAKEIFISPGYRFDFLILKGTNGSGYVSACRINKEDYLK